jgi:hypothetical protein
MQVEKEDEDSEKKIQTSFFFAKIVDWSLETYLALDDVAGKVVD